MSERMTLEQRTQSYIRDFELNEIICDKDFVTEEVKEQYPGTDTGVKSKRNVAYGAIYPTKEARDIELGMKQI